MPPIMANSKDGQVHKDKYLDTSIKIMSKEMFICNMSSKTYIYHCVMINVYFFLSMSNVKVLY